MKLIRQGALHSTLEGLSVRPIVRLALLALTCHIPFAHAQSSSSSASPAGSPSERSVSGPGSNSGAGSNSPSDSKADSSGRSVAGLARVLGEVRSGNASLRSDLLARESHFKARLAEARKRVEGAKAKLASREAEGKQLEARFDSNKHELEDKDQLLKNKIGQLKELFGVFQQNASDLIGAFNGSPTSLEYPDRDKWLEGFANRMRNASEVSSTDDIKSLWFEMMREIEARGDVVRVAAPVYAVDRQGVETGESSERSVVRVGGFHLIASEPSPQYLHWSAGRQHVQAMPRQPGDEYLSVLGSYLDAEAGLTALSVDPTGGTLVSLLAEKPTKREQADQGGLVGYIIIGLGLVAMVLAAIKLLDIGQIAIRLAAQRRRLDQPSKGNALGRLLRVYQQHRGADSEILELRLQEQVDAETDRIQRFTVFLVIISAVAPLLGLLGTVVGMINTFQAITLYGTGDPQTMAGGISQALITTVLGLIVAVPAVLLNALVSARAKSVVNTLVQQMALLLGDRKEAEYREEHRGALPPGDAVPSPA